MRGRPQGTYAKVPMLSRNKKKFDHRIKTIIGQLRTLQKKAEESPSDAYGQLHTIERSVQQAKMFKDLADDLYNSKDPLERKKNAGEIYDCLGFHRDELPEKNSD